MSLLSTLEPVTSDLPLVQTEVPGPRSRELHARRVEAVSAGVGWIVPVYIDSAHGAFLTDVDGNRFLDLGSGIGVTTIGHSNQPVIDAAVRQLNKVTHTLFTVTPYEGYVRLAERLAEKTPGNHAKKTMLVNTGAEAVENAVKIARKYTGRRAIAALDYAFHGRTNLTIAMNHKAVPYATGFGPFAPDVYRVPNSYPYRDHLSGPEAAARTIAYLEQRIGVSDLAAIIAEPIQGEGGFVVPADGYLPLLQEWATANGVVFIADEVQTGIARTGSWFVSEQFGLIPDMILTAKGMSAGLPLGGITGRAEMMDSVQSGALGGTFAGNPVAIAAAMAVFDELETGDYFEAAHRIGGQLRTELEQLACYYPVIGDIRGRGAMIAFELSIPGTTQPLSGLANAIAEYAAQQGVLLITAGADGNVIRFLPTLATTHDQIRYAVKVIGDSLALRS